MAFIVEMMWGRPHQITVYGPDEFGELVPQEVIPCEGEPDPEWRFFSCHGAVWEHVLDLGVRYGWKPMGTVPSRGSQWERDGCVFQNDYQPQMWGYSKQFLAEDAAGLADALQMYVSAVQGGEMVNTSTISRSHLQRTTRCQKYLADLYRATIIAPAFLS